MKSEHAERYLEKMPIFYSMDNMDYVKQKLRIALFHNLEPCGAKRALWNLVRELHHHGHELDLYTFTTADEQFLPLAPFVTQTVTVPIAPLHLRLPATLPVVDQARNVWNRLRHLPRIAEAHQKMAQRINQGQYDVAYIDCCMFTHIPDILRYLRIPSIFFCHEPSRKIHERPISLPRIPSSSPTLPKQPRWKNGIAKADGLAYALTEPLYKRAYHRNEEKNIRNATQVLTNSYYTRELIYQTYGVFANVNYLGVDTEFFKPLPNIAKEHIVLSVGRFDVLKQHHVVVQSVGDGILSAVRPAVAAEIDGDGTDRTLATAGDGGFRLSPQTGPARVAAGAVAARRRERTAGPYLPHQQFRGAVIAGLGRRTGGITGRVRRSRARRRGGLSPLQQLRCG